MRRALSSSLVSAILPALGYPAGYDVDAQAWFSAVEAAGGTLNATKKRAYHDFVVAEKAAGRWANLKLLFLPIHGVAAANAICARSLRVGTWVGTVTHAPGYVQGNGTTGCFDMGVSAATLGLTVSAGGLFFICTQPDSRGDFRAMMGASVTTGVEAYLAAANVTGIRWVYNNYNTSMFGSIDQVNQTAIISGDRVVGSVSMRRRSSSGAVSVAANPRGDQGVVPNINLYGMAINTTPVTYFSNGRFGCFGVDMGLSTTERDAFTANLKTMWEALSGLSLP